jgi:hypothetical protein
VWDSFDKIAGQDKATDSSVDPIVQFQPQREEHSMASKSGAAASMWPKIIFWLFIIIIGFGYIRSLAKRPGTESEPSVPAQTAVTESEPAGTPVKPEAVVSEEVEIIIEAVQVPESTDAVDSKPQSQVEKTISIVEQATLKPAQEVEVEQAAAATPIAAEEPGQPATSPEAAEPTVSEPATAAETKVEKSAPATSVAPTTASQTPVEAEKSVVGETAQDEQSQKADSETQQTTRKEIVSKYRQQRAESVSKILQEFDAMRKAAETEQQAMRELMERQRSRHWQSPPHYPAYPAWQERDYQSYPPAYNPYGYPQ